MTTRSGKIFVENVEAERNEKELEIKLQILINNGLHCKVESIVPIKIPLENNNNY